MGDEFISDGEVEAYERRTDPARRSVRWSLAAVAAAFVFIGGAYAFGRIGTGGSGENFLASIFGTTREDQGETFPLWSAGRDENTSFAANSDGPSSVAGSACGFESGPSILSGQATSLNISEVAWMGTEEGAQYEWIELANVGGTNAEIGGWSVVDKDEQIQFIFPKSSSIPAGGFLLLARSADRVGSTRADFRYTGNLKNEDEGLRFFNQNCEVIDEVVAAPKWPAGESAERRTMERNLSTLRQGSGQAPAWYTSATAGGTPKATNSGGWSNILNRSEEGAAGEVSSSTAASTTAEADRSDMSNKLDMSNRSGTVVISEVMAGKDGATNWDFVELHNQSAGTIDLTGWRMTKKSSTGNETSLVAIERFKDIKIPAGGYVLLAHPDYGGAADVVWPKSYTLAYTNNAVVLHNADGVKIDEVSWTEVPKGQSYAEVNGVWVIASPTPKAAP